MDDPDSLERAAHVVADVKRTDTDKMLAITMELDLLAKAKNCDATTYFDGKQ